MENHGDPVRYEKTDANAGAITRAMVALAVITVATAAILIPVFGYLEVWVGRSEQPEPPVARFAPGSRPPKPWLQEDPFKDIHELRAHEKAMLEQYSWADRAQGVIRMPIADAMEVALERGFPVREQAAPSQVADAAPAGGGR
jgi:hypothetical protein